MKLRVSTSAVEVVGSSHKGNTSAKGWLEYVSLCMSKSNILPKNFQVYHNSPPYVYKIPPMSKIQSLGAI